MDARHVITGIVCSVDDDPAAQAFSDYSLVLQAIEYAANNPIEPDFTFANAFPGDHYRLLSGLIQKIDPDLMVDIGTYRGCSARVMLDNSSESSSVITYDLYAHDTFDWTVLEDNDFASGRLSQQLKDLSDPDVFNEHKAYLNDAEFIMLDGPKDDRFEKVFLENLATLSMTHKSRWLLIDDIRFDNMYKLWRSIQSPKIDLSSFGHFSGTGLVNIEKGLILA